MNAGDTGFMLICTAFVFFMTPGLAFFYGGLVRRKNVVNTMMACGAIMGLSVVMWTLFGYSLAFGGNHGGIIGDFRWFALNGVGWEPGPYADTIPHLVFVAFQMMFAMITPALITGAVVGGAVFLYCDLVFDRVLSNGTYGLGRRWISGSHWLCGLCRRKCGTYQFRCQCTGSCHLSWTETRLCKSNLSHTQYPICISRSSYAVVRMVRL